LLIFACVDYALHIGFLDDGDRLYGSTLPFYPCCRCITFI
jgi:hypothetical protein